MPRKAKRSKKRLSRGISNYASPQGLSTSVEPPLQPSKLAQPCAPTITLNPSSISIAQNLVSPLDPQLHTMPHKAKHSNKRVRHGTSNLMSHASSQGHSAPVEPSLQPSKVAQPCAPTITIMSPLVPTAQNMVLTSDPPSRSTSPELLFL
ncbi:hypothetical protein E2542_SST30120 [Spatholobus suberectus]|nr:hypothetical protein E2542_SST30120 [Spatholobus suberectus]